MPHITGIVAADAVAHYGTDYISEHSDQCDAIPLHAARGRPSSGNGDFTSYPHQRRY
jgi:hypothetical protein